VRRFSEPPPTVRVYRSERSDADLGDAACARRMPSRSQDSPSSEVAMATALPAPTPSATPAPAVEVVTSLAGSIVSVDTLTADAAAPRRPNLPLYAGAALLAMAASTFGYGLYAAHQDAQARAAWAAEQRPAWAFRPTRHGATTDAAAALGSMIGLPLLGLGLARRRRADARTRFRVGAAADAELPLADATATYTLVDRGAEGFVAAIDGLDGDVGFAGTTTTLAAMRAAGHVALPLYVGTAVRTQVGRATIFVRGIDAPARSAPPALAWSRGPLAFFAASAVAHLGLLGLLQYAEPASIGAPTDLSLTEDSSSKGHLVSMEAIAPPPPEDGDADGSGATGSASAPTATAVIDGTLGTSTVNPHPARLRVADRGLSPRMAREAAIEQAATAGILSSRLLAGPLAVTGGADLASGFDDMDITGGFYDGGGTGAPTGTWGSGVRGTGTGCGTIAGVPCTGLASDPFATLGRDDGKNYLGTLGDDGDGRPRKRTPNPPTVKFSTPVACSADEPCLDKEIIRRHIARNREKIAYCYERELLAKPGLEGTVTVNFTLNGNGRVIQSTASGVDAAVSSCIAEVIANVAFPKVGGTGIYPIKYPFQLRPRG
jgi:hypothetical protein